MARHEPSRRTRRLSTTAIALSVAIPGALLGPSQAGATAAPLPATYAGSAQADIVDLSAELVAPLAPGSLTGATIAHSASSVTSRAPSGNTAARSANLDGSLVFGGVPIPIDTERVAAPPSADPAPRALVPLPLAPVATVGAITGDVQAAWAGADACVPAQSGTRALSQSRTTLAGVSLASAPAPIGSLLEMTASETTTGTYLVDDGVGGSDVVTRATTTVGDIDLLGGQVSIDVTHPVVLQGRSDGTTGAAGYVSPPTIVATVAGNPVPIPLNDTPQAIALPPELEPLVDLTITAFTPTDQSSEATGKATLDALFRVDLEVLALPEPAPAVTIADVSLAVAPMSVEALAPAGGVDCEGAGSPGPVAAPDITAPSDGATVSDPTPPISGTGEPGATVTVREGGAVLCTAVVRSDGRWSCSPSTPLADGPHVVTATQSINGETSDPDSTAFTILADPDDQDGDGLTTAEEVAHGTDPGDPDTDGDGLTDGQEVTGMKIRERFQICGRKNRKVIKVTTNPLRKDTDRDGISDRREVKGYKIKQRVKTRKGTFTIGRTRSNPRKKDTDRDGLKDKVEKTGKANKRFKKAKSDPSKCDTDKGGISDGAEIKARSNPADVRSGPRRPRGRGGASDRLPHGLG